MDTFRLLRQQAIDGLGAASPDSLADTAIGVWERLATQIVALVGEAGFDSLYARSVYLVQSSYPWLTEPVQTPGTMRRFDGLRAHLEAQAPELASAANRLLLSTFTDTLASLIGGALTHRVLNSAWGPLAPDATLKGKNNG
jgi:hypothetical protein